MVLVGALVLGVLLGTLQSTAKSKGKVDVVSSAVRSVVLLPAGSLRSGSDAWQDFVRGVLGGRRLGEENRLLRERNRQLEATESELARTKRDLEQLRQLSGVAPGLGTARIPATVVGYSPRDNRATLNVGDEDGVKPGLAVVTADGLLGLVQAVQQSTCAVALVGSPPPFSIGVVAQRNPPAAGLLTGEAPDRLRMELFDYNLPLEVGDEVVTSGYSTTIPGGIRIGRVVAIESDRAFGRKTALVFPFAIIGSARDVVVLK